MIHPTTICIVGTILNNKANFTTVGDIAVAGLNPALVMISLNVNHNATKSIFITNKMSINILESNKIKQVDFAGIHSSKQVDKSNLFQNHLVDDLPIVENAPINLIVKVLDQIQIKQRVIFVCEVIKTMIESNMLNDDKLDFSKFKPILYGLDNSYYSGLIKIGEGYKEGINHKIDWSNGY